MRARIAWIVTGLAVALLCTGSACSAVSDSLESVGLTGGSDGGESTVASSPVGSVGMSVDTVEPADPASLERIFLSGNDAAVSNGGKPCTWTLTEERRIREIWTYHWNEAQGTSGGGTITLKDAGGKTVGSWKVSRTPPGQGGVPNAYWVADVDLTLAPGDYTIEDSDPATWAQNALTKGVGHTWVMAERK
jgi:hypothetical protein